MQTRSKSPARIRSASKSEASTTPVTPVASSSTSRRTPKSSSRGRSKSPAPRKNSGSMKAVTTSLPVNMKKLKKSFTIIAGAIALVCLLLFIRGKTDPSATTDVPAVMVESSAPGSMNFDCCGTLSLAGSGIRRKYGAVAVYSVDMYTSEKALDGDVTAASLLAAPSPKAAELTIVFPQVSTKDFVKAITAVEGVKKDVLTDFKDKLVDGIGKDGLRKGDIMTLEWSDGGKSALTVTMNGEKIYSNKRSGALAKGVLQMYLGKKPVSPGLVKSIKKK